MEMNNLLADAVDAVAAETDEKLGAKLITSAADTYLPLFAGPPDSPSRGTLENAKSPSPLSLVLYKAACDVATASQFLGPAGFSTVGNSDFLNDLCSVANYERELTGTDEDARVHKPEVLCPGSYRAARLQAVFDHLTETFIRLIVPIWSTPGLQTDNSANADSPNMARIHRAAREAAVMVLRHMSGADRLGSVAPPVALGTSRGYGMRASSGSANEDLVRQTVQAIQNAAAQIGADAGIF